MRISSLGTTNCLSNAQHLKKKQYLKKKGARGFHCLWRPETLQAVFWITVGCICHNSDDVVPVGEEGDPIVECALLLVVEPGPILVDILGLDRGLAERLGHVFPGKDFVFDYRGRQQRPSRSPRDAYKNTRAG